MESEARRRILGHKMKVSQSRLLDISKVIREMPAGESLKLRHTLISVECGGLSHLKIDKG